MERWLSGRKRHTANVLAFNRAPGFESLPLRQDNFLSCRFKQPRESGDSKPIYEFRKYKIKLVETRFNQSAGNNCLFLDN